MGFFEGWMFSRIYDEVSMTMTWVTEIRKKVLLTFQSLKYWTSKLKGLLMFSFSRLKGFLKTATVLLITTLDLSALRRRVLKGSYNVLSDVNWNVPSETE